MSIIDPPIFVERKTFEVGTTGWTVDDLEDPEIERQWFAGHYEIVSGVMTKMAAAYYFGGKALSRLTKLFERYAEMNGIAGEFTTEADLVVAKDRVLRPDASFMTRVDDLAQLKAVRAVAGVVDRTGILVPPTLIIESTSFGHEAHDQLLKRRWYAEFNVPNYWILNAIKRSVECFRLRDGRYETDVAGSGEQILQPASFPGLSIPLTTLWAETA